MYGYVRINYCMNKNEGYISDGRPWSRRGRKSMENDEEKMKCSGIWRIRERLLMEMENLVKMKSRSGAMVWKVARGDEREG